MFLLPAKIVDVGIDYFTTAATDAPTATLLLLQADSIMQRERRLGMFVEPWTMKGYSGWKCGRLQFGERADGAIVRLSSGLADSDWWSIYQTTGRCSRIDLQVTLLCDGPVTAEVFAIAAQAKRFFENRTDGPRITLWSDNAHGATVYLGKRSSSLYFRAYNKGAQSELPEFENCLRLELEIKKRMCLSAITSLLQSETIQSGILGVLRGYLEARGISPNFHTGPLHLRSKCSLPVTDCLNSLRWLRSSVKPLVQRLIEEGLEFDVRECLGLH